MAVYSRTKENLYLISLNDLKDEIELQLDESERKVKMRRGEVIRSVLSLTSSDFIHVLTNQRLLVLDSSFNQLTEITDSFD